MSGPYGGVGGIDATSYGLNPGVATDAFTNTITYDQQPQDKRDEANRIFERWGQLDTEAINWKLHWQRVYEFIVPRKEDVIAVRMPGDDRESDIYDTTAVLCNEQLSAALHSMLTNPELRFFELLFGDPKLDDMPEVKQWCETNADRMYQVLNSSNFQTEIHEAYIDLCAAGTAILYMEENDDYVIHFSARALKECRLDENYLGQVDVLPRAFKLRPRQILQMFPKLGEEYGMPSELKEAADKNSADSIQILHMVEPVEDVRDEAHAARVKARGHKFSSTYMLYDKKFIISQESYEEFPYCSPRWSKTTGEKYGRGPGFQMLPDIMMLNAMMLTIIQAAQIVVSPPIIVEDDAVIGQVRLTPAGLTIVRAGSEPPKPLMSGGRIDLGQTTLEDIRKRIRSGFHLDQLALPQESPQRTAEEVRQIVEEQMRLMGPVLGRMHFELLRPLITRLFGIMNRKNMLTPPPAVIKGKKFAVRYSSILARAQKMNDMQNIQRALTTIQPLQQIDPTVKDNVKMDDLVQEILRGYGVAEKFIPSPQELRKVRTAQQQAAQDAKQKADALHQSEVSKNTAPMVQQMVNAKQAGQPQGMQPQQGFGNNGGQ